MWQYNIKFDDLVGDVAVTTKNLATINRKFYTKIDARENIISFDGKIYSFFYFLEE